MRVFVLGLNVFARHRQCTVISACSQQISHVSGQVGLVSLSILSNLSHVQIPIFNKREGCLSKSKEYTDRKAGNQNDDICVIVKYGAMPANVDAVQLIFSAFGNSTRNVRPPSDYFLPPFVMKSIFFSACHAHLGGLMEGSSI